MSQGMSDVDKPTPTNQSGKESPGRAHRSAPSRYPEGWQIGLIIYLAVTFVLLVWSASKQDRWGFVNSHPVISALIAAAVLLFVVGTVVWAAAVLRQQEAPYMPTVLQFKVMGAAFLLALPLFGFEYGRQRALTKSPPGQLSSVAVLRDQIGSQPVDLLALRGQAVALAKRIDKRSGNAARQVSSAESLSKQFNDLAAGLAGMAATATELGMSRDTAALKDLTAASTLLAQSMDAYTTGLYGKKKRRLRDGRRQLDRAQVVLGAYGAQGAAAEATASIGGGFVNNDLVGARKAARALGRAARELRNAAKTARILARRSAQAGRK